MSGWNYRVIRCRERDPLHKKRWLYWYDVREAYYDDHGRVWAITQGSSGPHGETAKELRDDMSYIMAAFVKPVLDEWKLPEKGAKGPCKGHECKRVKERDRGKRIRRHSSRLR